MLLFFMQRLFFLFFAPMEIITADLCDKYSDTLKISEPIGLRNYGGNTAFMGVIHTVKCFENNQFVRAAL
jgi:regulator of ribonuclease activity A